jgi:hypothetical protein
LNAALFDSLSEALRKLARWRNDTDHIRPHSALGNLAPAQSRHDRRTKRWPGHHLYRSPSRIMALPELVTWPIRRLQTRIVTAP